MAGSVEMSQFHQLFKESFDIDGAVVPMKLSHPKLLKLEEVILGHFESYKSDTRVMIFSQYRESVYEITGLLAQHGVIKAMEFVGQSASSSGGGRRSVSQKEQLEVITYLIFSLIFQPYLIWQVSVNSCSKKIFLPVFDF